MAGTSLNFPSKQPRVCPLFHQVKTAYSICRNILCAVGAERPQLWGKQSANWTKTQRLVIAVASATDPNLRNCGSSKVAPVAPAAVYPQSRDLWRRVQQRTKLMVSVPFAEILPTAVAFGISAPTADLNVPTHPQLHGDPY